MAAYKRMNFKIYSDAVNSLLLLFLFICIVSLEKTGVLVAILPDYNSFDDIIFHQQASPYIFIYIIHMHLKKSQIGALTLKTKNEVRAYPMRYSPLSYSSP